MPDGSLDQDLPERSITQEFALKDENHKDAVQLGETDRLTFARQILGWLVVVTLVSFGAYICFPENKGAAEVFDLVKVGVLPLVTLVIGFYFPNSKK